MKKVLLTGANGFIGRQCIPALLTRGYEVHAVSSSSVKDEENHVFRHRADLLSAPDVESLMEAVKPTHLLHLAWYTEHGKFWNSRENLRWVEASTGLLYTFVSGGGQRFVGCGTGVEYDWRYGYCVEDVTPVAPDNVYGGCKLAFKSVLNGLIRAGDLDGAWGRVFFLYGPGENRKRLVSSVINALLRDDAAPCSHGNQIRDFLHVKDVAAGLVGLLDSEFQGAVNISSGEPLRLRDMIFRIADHIGNRDLVDLGAIPPPENEAPLVVGNNERLVREIGWKAEFSLDAGLEDTIAWWKGKFGV